MILYHYATSQNLLYIDEMVKMVILYELGQSVRRRSQYKVPFRYESNNSQILEISNQIFQVDTRRFWKNNQIRAGTLPNRRTLHFLPAIFWEQALEESGKEAELRGEVVSQVLEAQNGNNGQDQADPKPQRR